MQISHLESFDRMHFYAAFKNILKIQIKELFVKHGWQVRKSSWSDFELTNSWSELNLEGAENAPLLNGLVIYESSYLSILDNTLNCLTGEYRYELYHDDGTMLLMKLSADY